MKKVYMKPLTEVVKTVAVNTYLVSASGDGLNLPSGGGSSAGGVKSGDAKGRGDYGQEEEPSFGDLW